MNIEDDLLNMFVRLFLIIVNSYTWLFEQLCQNDLILQLLEYNYHKQYK